MTRTHPNGLPGSGFGFAECDTANTWYSGAGVEGPEINAPKSLSSLHLRETESHGQQPGREPVEFACTSQPPWARDRMRKSGQTRATINLYLLSD